MGGGVSGGKVGVGGGISSARAVVINAERIIINDADSMERQDIVTPLKRIMEPISGIALQMHQNIY